MESQTVIMRDWRSDAPGQAMVHHTIAYLERLGLTWAAAWNLLMKANLGQAATYGDWPGRIRITRPPGGRYRVQVALCLADALGHGYGACVLDAGHGGKHKDANGYTFTVIKH